MGKKRPPREVMITGFVRGDDWDFDGNPIAVTIEADEEEYSVELDGLGEELLDYVGEEVEVRCTVEKDEDGTLHIRVQDYDVISEGDEEEERSYAYEDDDEILEDEDGYDEDDKIS
jgi:hypothetical protein